MNTSQTRYNSSCSTVRSSSGTVSTAYTSTARSSQLTSTTGSTGFISSGSVEQQAIHGLTARLVVERKRNDVLPEVNMEKEKQFDGFVQEFFGSNCSMNRGEKSVLERWFRELHIPWVLHLADGAAAGRELERSLPSQERPYAVCSWIRALAEIMGTSISARSLFPDRSSQFTRFTQETVLKMLPFVDVIVATTDEAFHSEWVDAPYKKIKTLLDVRDALSKALSKIGFTYRRSTQSAEVETIQAETLLSAKKAKLDEAIWNTMEEIRRGILEPLDHRSNDSSGAHTPRVSPAIYNVTRSVIRYVLFLKTNYSSVAPVLYEASSLGKIVNEIDNTDPLSSLTLEMISSIEEKLTEKSESFPDQGFRFMFLMNNSCVIQQLLRHSASEFVLESHMQILTNKIESYMRDYVEASWAPVLSCLYCTAPPRLGRDLLSCLYCAAPFRFGRDSPFTKFKKEFQKTYSTQKLWPVRNPELRNELRKAISDKVISGMRKYLVDNITTTRRVELEVEVEEMEKMLQQIFEG